MRVLPSPTCDIPVLLLTATRIAPAHTRRAKSVVATAMFTSRFRSRSSTSPVRRAHYRGCLYRIHPDESAMVEEAIEYVRRGLKLARDNQKTYLFVGRRYKAVGKSDTAEKMSLAPCRSAPILLRRSVSSGSSIYDAVTRGSSGEFSDAEPRRL